MNDETDPTIDTVWLDEESDLPLPESRWTRATTRCPHPERWSSTDEDSTEVEVSQLIAAFVLGLQPDLVVETGSAWGQTTELIGLNLARNGRGHLISYEVNHQRVNYTQQRCAGLPVHVRKQASLEGMRELIATERKAGLIFLDSLFPLRVEELALCPDLLTPGGVVILHDTGPQHPLWADLEAGGHLEGWNWLNLPTPRGVAILQYNNTKG